MFLTPRTITILGNISLFVIRKRCILETLGLYVDTLGVHFYLCWVPFELQAGLWIPLERFLTSHDVGQISGPSWNPF